MLKVLLHKLFKIPVFFFLFLKLQVFWQSWALNSFYYLIDNLFTYQNKHRNIIENIPITGSKSITKSIKTLVPNKLCPNTQVACNVSANLQKCILFCKKKRLSFSSLA